MKSEEIRDVCRSAKVDEIKSYIERRKELGLELIEIYELIKATKDVEYINNIISNSKKRSELD